MEGGMTEFPGTGRGVRAYVAKPGRPGPAVIVIHEIWGLNDHIKDVANRFAAEGYELFAPDNVVRAMGFMQKLPPEKRGDAAFVQERMGELPEGERGVVQRLLGVMLGGKMPVAQLTSELEKAVEYLGRQTYVLPGRVGSVGFCFGGGMSASLACRGKTAACVIFYGANPSPLELVEGIRCPVLGIYGGDDMRIDADLDKLTAAMIRYRKDFEMKIYPGAPHAFFNDTNRATYRADAARDAWERTKGFFARTLSA